MGKGRIVMANGDNTMSTPLTFQSDSAFGEPTWEIAHLFPARGAWEEEDYLALHTNRLVELSNGDLEMLPMPTEAHQFMALFLYRMVFDFVAPRGLGAVLAAPLRVRLGEGKFREPDVVFMLEKNKHRRKGKYWDRADLVMEVVSDDDPDRDHQVKRHEYAKAGIPEYWIVDPKDKTIIVLTLHNSATAQAATAYTITGEYGPGQAAVSALLPGLSVDVDSVFSQSDH